MFTRGMAYTTVFHPGVVLTLAVAIPLLLVLALAVYRYSPLLPGLPPRSYPPLLFWLNFAVALGLFQALPFGSLFGVFPRTLAFGAFMWVLVFGVSLYVACNYGDCF